MRRIAVLFACCAWVSSAWVSSAWGMGMTAPAGTEDDVALVWDSPGCEHEKLASVEIEAGQRVSENTKDTNVPTVDYARAMSKLAQAAREKGANAVVLRWHQGVYFTRNGKQSRRPVYVKLRGAAIRIADPAHCPVRPVEVADLEARSTGKPVNVDSREAFEGE